MAEGKRRLIEEAQRVNPVQAVHLWRSPASAATEVLVMAHLDAYAAIHEQAAAALPNETGGFLIGRVLHDQRDGCWILEIEEALPVEPTVQHPTHFQFTWRDVDRVRTYRESTGKALMGWYHTHPGLDIFLSETDLDRTHRVLFSEPFQVALVYDPLRGKAGYFFWEGPQTIDASVAPWREFTIMVDDTQAATPAVASAPILATVAPPGDAEAGETASGLVTEAGGTDDAGGSERLAIDPPARRRILDVFKGAR